MAVAYPRHEPVVRAGGGNNPVDLGSGELICLGRGVDDLESIEAGCGQAVDPNPMIAPVFGQGGQ
jgi:hypothetical protein